MRIPENMEDAVWKATRVFPQLEGLKPGFPDQGGENFTIFFDDKVVQMPRQEESIRSFQRQIELLEKLEKQDLGVKIPRIIDFDNTANVMMSELITGKPLNEFTLHAMSKPEQEEIGMQLGTFLRQLHSLNPSTINSTKYVENKRGYISSILLQLNRFGLAEAARLEEQDINVVRWYLTQMSSLPDDTAMLHGDLSYRNILYDSEKKRISIIDFGSSREGYRHEDFLYVGGFPALVQDELNNAYGQFGNKPIHRDLLEISRKVENVFRVIAGSQLIDRQPVIVRDYN